MPDFLEERFLLRMKNKDYAFAADILRVFVIYTFGGIYFDIDTDTERGFKGISIEKFDGCFRHHENSDPTMSNDFVGMSANHPLGKYLISTMRAPAYDFGPHWLGYNVKDYLKVDRNAPHAETRKALESINMLYMPSNKDETDGLPLDVWEGHFHNRALYSWSKEGRELFERGEYL